MLPRFNCVLSVALVFLGLVQAAADDKTKIGNKTIERVSTHIWIRIGCRAQATKWVRQRDVRHVRIRNVWDIWRFLALLTWLGLG